MIPKKTTTILLLLVLLGAAQLGQADSYDASGDCPEDPQEDGSDRHPYGGPTTERAYGRDVVHHICAPDGGAVVPALVTGHTVYTYTTLVVEGDTTFDPMRDGYRLPSVSTPEFHGTEDVEERIPATKDTSVAGGLQAECVVWANGENVASMPYLDDFDLTNDHFSDEDQLSDGNDTASQDYDLDRIVESCGPETLPDEGRFVGVPTDFGILQGHFLFIDLTAETYDYGDYAVVVESGDCDPRDGTGFSYRGHLDFIDPNGVYHDVQEYDYSCTDTAAAGIGLLDGLYTTGGIDDPYNTQGCTRTQALLPGTMADSGHKCRGTVRDLLTERLWITRIHGAQFDPTIGDFYTFALAVDTCSGRNVHDADGMQTDPAYMLPGSASTSPDLCTDGSSYSLDNTRRGNVIHAAQPGTIEELMRGNAYNETNEHREAYRHDARTPDGGWPFNEFPRGTNIPPDGYPEDHKAALVDLYIVRDDPTGRFDQHAMTTDTFTASNGDSDECVQDWRRYYCGTW